MVSEPTLDDVLRSAADGIEAGLRQLRRTRPLEIESHALPDGQSVVVPTLPEMLRVKAYLVVQRNATRDYLDTVALADRLGLEGAVETLAQIDAYYADRSGESDSVLTALVQRLAEPAPRDRRVTTQLAAYKGLDPKWGNWAVVMAACEALADALLAAVETGQP
jgi:hypothetical protein